VTRAYISAALRRSVGKRARECCEYCLLPADAAEYPHEVDHLLALKHGGSTDSDNLALACFKCNRNKGSDLSAIDPIDKLLIPLFNPRTQVWTEHFKLAGPLIIGQTPAGRATVNLLQLNSESRLERRRALIEAGRYPPPWAG
jgi:hypothetical protein